MKRLPVTTFQHSLRIAKTDFDIIGMLTFIMYYLLKNPDCMQKLRDEIDTMIGDRPMAPDDVNKLPYLIGRSLTGL